MCNISYCTKHSIELLLLDNGIKTDYRQASRFETWVEI